MFSCSRSLFYYYYFFYLFICRRLLVRLFRQLPIAIVCPCARGIGELLRDSVAFAVLAVLRISTLTDVASAALSQFAGFGSRRRHRCVLLLAACPQMDVPVPNLAVTSSVQFVSPDVASAKFSAQLRVAPKHTDVCFVGRCVLAS